MIFRAERPLTQEGAPTAKYFTSGYLENIPGTDLARTSKKPRSTTGIEF